MTHPMRVIAVMILALASEAAFAAPSVTALPARPRPGEVLFLTLSPEAQLSRAACSWRGRSYQFQPGDGVYQLALPVSAGTRPGGYHATVYWKYTNGEGGQTVLPVEISPRKFGVQNLHLSAKQEQKYSAPDTAREYRLIGEALDQVTPKRLWKGDFLMPLDGRITTEFGLQRYVNGHFDYRHKGLDIAGKQGAPVRAAASGVVSLADETFQLHGKTIVIDHGQGTSSLYLHLSEIDVSPGDTIVAGQLIGRVGSTGIATGPHLHYAVYAYHEAVDPRCWLHVPE